MPDVTVSVVRSVPRQADVVGWAVAPKGPVPRQLGLNRAGLEANGFTGKPGSTLIVPTREGPTMIAVGTGDDPSPRQLRDAAAALTRAAGKRAHIATNLADVTSGDAAAAAQAVTEGVLLANYRYLGVKTDTSGASKLETLSLVSASAGERSARRGAERGAVTSGAANLARELANMPANLLTARGFAAKAQELASSSGIEIEVFDRDQLAVMGCGGIVGVNLGSIEPPRMVKLTYTPRAPRGHVALVGKGVMYDSGGLSLKPTNPMSVLMKMDMSGAAAVLATMTTLKQLGCKNKVTAFMMCTDNMPSGTAVKLGDVLTFRNGKTAEIHNTDAEGRLVLADGLSLAVEESPDAVVDIATLTGACVVSLGQKIAGLVSNNQTLADSVLTAGRTADESLWQMPLAKEYRKLLDSNVADMKNIGGPYGGVITSSLFLNEFVGDTPWAHLDIAGPMHADADEGWLAKGATAFGTRTLIELATTFTSPTT
jgi:leucyl aminopeptidase